MRTVIYMASDWNFKEIRENFEFSENSLKDLTAKYGCSRFVVDFCPMEDGFDAEITIYDYYLE